MGLDRILVVNAGSSSLKFKLFDVLTSGLVAGVSGLVERIGDVVNSRFIVKVRTRSRWCAFSRHGL